MSEKSFIIRPYTFLILFVFFLIIVQDLIAARIALMPGAKIIGQGFLFFKELLIFAGALLVYQRVGNRLEIKLALIFFLLTILYIFVSPLPLGMALQDFRPYALILCAFVIGDFFGKADIEFRTIVKWLIYFTVFIIVFAFIEHYIFPETMFRKYFPVVKIATEIKGFSDEAFYINGLPGNFINSGAGQRMVGPFGDPLYMGYFLIFCMDVIFSWWFYRQRQFNVILCILLISLLCIFLGQVRALWIGLVASLFITFFNLKYFKYLIAGAFVLGIFVAIKSELIIITVRSMFDWSDGSAHGHILAYVDAIPRIIRYPFGHGVGTAGYFAVRSQSRAALDIVGVENAYLNLALELGIIPAVCIFLVSLYIIVKSRGILLGKLAAATINQRIVLFAGMLLNIQFLIAGFVSPHILTVRIIIPFWFLNGYCIAILRNINKERKGTGSTAEPIVNSANAVT
jgi:hypothetical protein